MVLRIKLTLLVEEKDPVPNGSNGSLVASWEPKFAKPWEEKGSETLSSLLKGSSSVTNQWIFKWIFSRLEFKLNQIE